MKSSGEKILTPLVSLDTPGKATVQVVIVADPVSILLKKTLKLIQDNQPTTQNLTYLTIFFIINHNHPYIWRKIVLSILINNFVLKS